MNGLNESARTELSVVVHWPFSEGRAQSKSCHKNLRDVVCHEPEVLDELQGCSSHCSERRGIERRDRGAGCENCGTTCHVNGTPNAHFRNCRYTIYEKVNRLECFIRESAKSIPSFSGINFFRIYHKRTLTNSEKIVTHFILWRMIPLLLLATLFVGPVRCETNIDECASDPCYHNGTCVDGVNGYRCNCSEGFLGDFCEYNLSESCDHDPCDNNATCVNVTTEYSDIFTFNCSCLPGFTGRYCETEIDFCESVTCQNGATCESLTSQETHVCRCAAGYTGDLCQTEINECESDPCQNSAPCTDKIDEFLCNCTEGWDGDTCGGDIDECAVDPCVNGQCDNLPGSYRCDCDGSGYEGVFCQTDINECDLGYCQNGAECENFNGTYSCNCTLGYEGDNCEIANCSHNQCVNGDCEVTISGGVEKWHCECTDFYEGELCDLRGPCADMPCENNATCEQSDHLNYTCICEEGWEGENCTEDIDECETDEPCENGATCVNAPGDYECQCADGFTGEHCETDIDECEENPDLCEHGGVCINTPGGFECNCTAGYEGDLCQDNINECLETPCLNNGTCTDLDPGFNCSCPPGYVGDVCHSVNPCNDSNYCANDGRCDYVVDDTSQNVTASCDCVDPWLPPRCLKEIDSGGPEPVNKKSPDDNSELIYIIIGVVVGALVVVIAIALIIVVLRVKEKRATRGTYSPSRQEMSGSRVDMGNHLKIPPPERLI